MIGAGAIASQLDRFVVAEMWGLAAVGRYAIALDLASRLWPITSVVGKAYYAQLAAPLAHGEPRQHAAQIRHWFLANAGISAALAVPATVFSGVALTAWLGIPEAELGDSIIAFPILAWGVVLTVASSPPVTVLQFKRQFGALIKLYGAMLVVHAVGLVLLAKQFGPVGAAVSWTAVQLLITTSFCALLWHRFKVNLLGDAARLVAGCLVGTALAMACARLWSLPSVPVGLPLVRRAVAVLPLLTCGVLLSAVAVVFSVVIGKRDAVTWLRRR
jgi:O-antigen/teichoic acid export membrane protein